MRNGGQAPEVLFVVSVSDEIVKRNRNPRSFNVYLLYTGF